MKNFINVLLFKLVVVLCFVSCKKHKDEAPAPVSLVHDGGDYLNSCKFNTGDYWIYQKKITYANGNIQYFATYDSVYIEKDTIIEGRNAWVQRTRGIFHPVYLIDSADCIIRDELSEKRIVFSKDFTKMIVKDSLYSVRMAQMDQVEDVPLGSFETIRCLTLEKMDHSNHTGHGGYPMYGIDKMIVEQRVYANNVGLINTITYYLGNVIEDRLVRYKKKGNARFAI